MNSALHGLQSLTTYVPSKAFEGYTLFASMERGDVWLIDMRGRIVHHWDMPLPTGSYGILLPNGNLLYSGRLVDTPLPEFGGVGGKLMEVDWDGTIIWEYEDQYMHHDFQRLTNGNTMILKWVETPREIALKVKGGVPGTEKEGVMWSDSFQEITPEGKIVWEWLGYEHLDPEETICPLCARSDWTHANTCFVLENGDILTSLLTLNTICIIDRATKKIKWRWGKEELAHPHNPHVLSNGNIIIFDNGTHRPSSEKFPVGFIGISRVLEIEPKSGNIIWEFRDDSPLRFFASHISGCQRLPNGNTFICEGPKGRFFEVTPDKELVWEYINPFFFQDERAPDLGWHNTVFRAYRYAPDYPGLIGKKLDPERIQFSVKIKPEDKEKIVEKRLRRLGY
jgi:hypothetical protein